MSAFVLLPTLGGLVGITLARELQSRLDRGIHAAIMSAWGQPSLLGAALVSATIGGTPIRNVDIGGWNQAGRGRVVTLAAT